MKKKHTDVVVPVDIFVREKFDVDYGGLTTRSGGHLT